MGIRPGQRLGAFEVLGPLGTGGMGEVYRARDPRLGREVALKVLPRSVSQDAPRLARFDREARFLAALNHPGIGAIYGIEESEDGPLLVLELVSGETLSERLRGHALPVTEALSVCRQIADAVAYAHAKGVIHRDLKPANVKRTREGHVKLLDFGLAEALASGPGASTKGPTITEGETREGSVLGTPAYMSPEQARGKEVDKRTDVWSFGCVLYETLTGRRALHGKTVTDTLVAVLGHEPDWSALPASTPPSIRALLRRCLQRDRERRLHDMADARIELDDAIAAPDPALGATATAAPALGGGSASGLEIASVGAGALDRSHCDPWPLGQGPRRSLLRSRHGVLAPAPSLFLRPVLDRDGGGRARFALGRADRRRPPAATPSTRPTGVRRGSQPKGTFLSGKVAERVRAESGFPHPDR